jgi:hypothetical protein
MSFISTFTFQRPTTLDYLDGNGVTQTAAINEPAFAFFPNGAERGSQWTDDTVCFLADCADKIGQVQGYFLVVFEAPVDETLYLMDLSFEITAGINMVEFLYTPDAYTVRLNGSDVGTVSGSFDWSGMDRIEIGNFDGDLSPDGYFFRAFGNSKSASQVLTSGGSILVI